MFLRFFICTICIISTSTIINAQYIGFLGVKKTIEIKNINQGKVLYLSKCANCHGTTKAAIGSGLQKIRLYRSGDYLYRYITNPAKFISENAEAYQSWRKYKVLMPAFPQLSIEGINKMLDYLDSLPYDSNNYPERRDWKKL